MRVVSKLEISSNRGAAMRIIKSARHENNGQITRFELFAETCEDKDLQSALDLTLCPRAEDGQLTLLVQTRRCMILEVRSS